MSTKKTDINYEDILTIEKGKLTGITDGNYKEIVLPSTVKSIAKGAFGSVKIKKLILPGTLKKIAAQNFKGSTGISEIVISNGTDSIGKEAFVGCKALKNVTLSDSITEIGEKAFKDCIKLTEIVIPSSVNTLGESVFSGCKSLTDITFNNSKLSFINFDKLLMDCKKLTNICMAENSCFSSQNGMIIDKETDSIIFIAEGIQELILPETVKEATISSKVKKLTIEFVPKSKSDIIIDTTSIDTIDFTVIDKTYSFDLEHEKYCLEKYGYYYSRKELYPQKKDQVLKLLNDIINIIFSGEIIDKKLGEAVYSGWSDIVTIIEPLLNLRISLSEAVAEIYGIDKYTFFDKLFEPVVSQGSDFDVADDLHKEIIKFFSDNPDKITYIEHFPELKSEIESAGK